MSEAVSAEAYWLLDRASIEIGYARQAQCAQCGALLAGLALSIEESIRCLRCTDSAVFVAESS